MAKMGRPRKSTLSSSDVRLLKSIFTGNLPATIAASEGVARQALANKLSRAYKVLGVSSISHAIYRALELGYLQPPKVLPEVAKRKEARLAKLSTQKAFSGF